MSRLADNRVWRVFSSGKKHGDKVAANRDFLVLDVAKIVGNTFPNVLLRFWLQKSGCYFRSWKR